MDSRDELLELVIACSSDQVKYLANWVIAYDEADDRKEREAKLERLIYRNRFARMAAAFEGAARKEKPELDRELFDFYASFIRPAIPNSSRKPLDELCYAGHWKEAAALVEEIDRDAEAGSHAREYERLVTDPAYLIERVIRIMRREYSRRLDEARKAMNDYVEPHRTALARLADNLREAHDARSRLESSVLAREERDGLGEAIGARIAEMEGLRARELENLAGAKAFAEDVQRIARQFEALVALLQRKRDAIGERKRYEAIASRLEIETAEMDELFRDMRGGLERDMERVRGSFALLEGAFRNGLAEAIGEQERVTRVLDPEADAEGQPPRADRDRYEEILRVLKNIDS